MLPQVTTFFIRFILRGSAIREWPWRVVRRAEGTSPADEGKPCGTGRALPSPGTDGPPPKSGETGAPAGSDRGTSLSIISVGDHKCRLPKPTRHTGIAENGSRIRTPLFASGAADYWI